MAGRGGERQVLELGSEIRVIQAPYQELHALMDVMYGIAEP